MGSDPWAVLGVPRGSDKAAVKAAYRKLALRCHPDLCGASPEAVARFNEIKAAADSILVGVSHVRWG
jgi:molecular chaperone DnaJ